jgi:hypothetical protein
MEDVGVTVGKVTDRIKTPGDYIIFTGVKSKGKLADHVLVATALEDGAVSFFDPQIGATVRLNSGERWVAYPVVYPD